MVRNNVALVGDASCTVDGVSGQGLSLAFQQALALGDALAAGDLASLRDGAPANYSESDADGSTDAADGSKHVDPAEGAAAVCRAAGIIFEDYCGSHGRRPGRSTECERGV